MCQQLRDITDQDPYVKKTPEARVYKTKAYESASFLDRLIFKHYSWNQLKRSIFRLMRLNSTLLTGTKGEETRRPREGITDEMERADNEVVKQGQRQPFKK